jgi:sugar/nucleoside kinase (ribokinase family)
MSKSWDVAVAGELFADHVFSGFQQWPQPGEEHFTDNYTREVGGGAAITACALARLGRSVCLFGIAGQEDLWFSRRLNNFGVNVSGLRTTVTNTAVSVSISTHSDRSFFTWPGANRDLPPYLAGPGTQARLAQARHVHLAMPLERALASQLIPTLRAAGCTLSLDVGHQVRWLHDQANRQTCSEVDFFLPNEVEARIITGFAEPERMLASLQAMGIQRAVVKLGRAGAAASHNQQLFFRLPPQVAAVDSTGAGDAFNAGLIDAFLDGSSLPGMLWRACLCGSLSTRSPGAVAALPTREELDSFHD